ncbi:MAG: class I mannose-6-phosphate isomerase [Lachnospiraceae bacterium]|nr:class I mannose-6-phosphate isomerase [Lachnospiraceae bacterium]
MEIMKLIPAGKDYIWGGTRLRDEFGKKCGLTPLAETWECSVHPDGPSIVAEGAFAGRTLSEVLKVHPEYLGTKVGEKKELPILVKFIDAKEDLSIQVHPDDEYARLHEGQNGKTELWYVMDAARDAGLIYGFAHPVTAEILEKAIAEGTLDKHLQKVKVKKGDVYYVPAGTVHGIGAGTLIAEIQESSNVTYRVFDYNRLDQYGNPRPLHFEKAVDVMDRSVAPDIRQKSRLVHYYPGCSRELICRCQYFEVEKVRVRKEFSFSVREESFQVLLCMDGNGILSDMFDRSVDFAKGECLFIPADIGRCSLIGNAELLKVRC